MESVGGVSQCFFCAVDLVWRAGIEGIELAAPRADLVELRVGLLGQLAGLAKGLRTGLEVLLSRRLAVGEDLLGLVELLLGRDEAGFSILLQPGQLLGVGRGIGEPVIGGFGLGIL